MKFILEKEVIKNNGLIIRMGWPNSKNDELINLNDFNIAKNNFTDLKFIPIYVHGTKIEDIFKIISRKD